MENINIAILQNAAIAMYIYATYVPIKAFLLLSFFKLKVKMWFKTCLLSVWVSKMFLRICLQNISFIFWGVCEKKYLSRCVRDFYLLRCVRKYYLLRCVWKHYLLRRVCEVRSSFAIATSLFYFLPMAPSSLPSGRPEPASLRQQCIDKYKYKYKYKCKYNTCQLRPVSSTTLLTCKDKET